jgi:uncharacterized surface protein with fasciclin (FAS1) repeats
MHDGDTNMTRTILTTAVAALLAVPAMAAGQTQTHAHGADLVQVARDAGSFTTLLRAVEAAGLADVLRGTGPFTVFAPTDAAFAKLPAGTIEALLADREQLVAVLTYHVVPGRVTAEQVLGARSLKAATVQGQELSIEVKDGKVHVDGATVVQADVMASNGVIHVIDTVVLPRR